MTNKFDSFLKQKRFEDLCAAVEYCTLCPAVAGRKKVLSHYNGDINSKVCFVAEAPGRLGADRTAVPLFGDATGKNFETLLANIGWRREDIFITNAVLCNPRDGNGNNVTPSPEQIENCSAYLEMTIELLQPEAVISLGTTALEALKYISPHKVKLPEDVGKMSSWAGRKLIPLYHPGPRALVHRSLIKQRSDFIALAKKVDPVNGIIHKPKKIYLPSMLNDSNLTSFHQLILAIVGHMSRLTYFRLTKLLYLVDLACIERFGCSATGEIYLRQEEGPWPPKLKKEIRNLDGYEILTAFVRGAPTVSIGPSPRFDVRFNESVLQVILEILEKYGGLNNARIKSIVYNTPPMKYILHQESIGRDMRNVPIIYKNKTVQIYDQERRAKGHS